MQCPLLGPQMTLTIEWQVDAFSNADSSDASQQESIGIEVVCSAQFILKPFIIFWRQRPGEILGTNREIFADNQARLEAMALRGQVVEQTTKTEQALLARVVADRRTQLTKPAEPAQHMGIAAELGESMDLWKGGVKISNEAAGNVLVLDHGEGLQSQRKSLDLCFENLFESLPGLTHGIRGAVKRARLATARAYSRQTSCGASWT